MNALKGRSLSDDAVYLTKIGSGEAFWESTMESHDIKIHISAKMSRIFNQVKWSLAGCNSPVLGTSA